MIDTKIIDVVKASYVRCYIRKGFFDDFYEDFMKSDPGIAEKFQHTDMYQQKKLLEDGIMMMIMFAEGHVIGIHAMERIARTHDVRHANIEAKWYSFWIESLLRVIGKHDAGCNEDVIHAWRMVIASGVEYLIKNHA